MRAHVQRILHRLCFRLGLSQRWARNVCLPRILMLHDVGFERRPAAVFEEQLRLLSRMFDVLPLGELLRRWRDDPSRVRHSVALTLDDGLRNHREVAYPILERTGTPATFYVCPCLVDEGRWLWPQESRERLRSLGRKTRERLLEDLLAPSSDPDGIVRWMKTLDLASRERVEEMIRDVTPGFQPSVEQKARFDLMNWKELESLDPALVTIGSHTATHPILTRVGRSDLIRELEVSRQRLEERLERPVEHFAYPDGAYDRTVVEAARSHYASAVTAERGWILPSDDVWRLRRVPVPGTIEGLAWNLHRPTL